MWWMLLRPSCKTAGWRHRQRRWRLADVVGTWCASCGREGGKPAAIHGSAATAVAAAPQRASCNGNPRGSWAVVIASLAMLMLRLTALLLRFGSRRRRPRVASVLPFAQIRELLPPCHLPQQPGQGCDGTAYQWGLHTVAGESRQQAEMKCPIPEHPRRWRWSLRKRLPSATAPLWPPPVVQLRRLALLPFSAAATVSAPWRRYQGNSALAGAAQGSSPASRGPYWPPSTRRQATLSPLLLVATSRPRSAARPRRLWPAQTLHRCCHEKPDPLLVSELLHHRQRLQRLRSTTRGRD
mmetsp:Transcript_8877/g.22153  ORF Transcript_8877/g.22153 Transcript_8877/m.22153 type:complete len:296 (-) Transcript_8877:493-1380(-)